VVEIAQSLGIEVPIALGVHAVIDERASPAEMLERLMTRRLKEETEESLYRDFLLKKP
jgi:glycerol-3-phosphate dehydrogenase